MTTPGHKNNKNQHTLSTKLETFLLDLKEGATATVRFLRETV
jgi:hypothetical protein